MAVIFSEDFAYASSATPISWDQTKWNTALVNGTSHALNSMGRLMGTGSTHYAGQTSKMTARTGDFEVTFSIQKTSTSFHSGVQVQASGSLAYDSTYGYTFNNGYLFYNDGSTAWRLVKRAGAAGGTTIVSQVFGAYTASTWYNVRWKKVGTLHSIKMWAASTSEPTTWTTGTEAAGTPTLAAGVLHVGHRGTMSTFVDSIVLDDLAVAGGTDVTIMETPATASAQLMEPSVSTQTVVNGGYSAQVMTASAALVNPTFKTGTVYATDFETYALGTPAGWTKRLGDTYTIAESAGTLSGKWMTAPSNSNVSIYTYNAPASVTGNTLMRVYNNGGAVFAYVNTTNYYRLWLESGTSPTLYFGSNLGTTTSAPVTANTNGFNWLRVDVSGSRVKARVWPNGAVEPSTWNIDVAATTGSGLWGVAAYTSRASAYDYYALNTNEGEVAAAYSRGKEIGAVAVTATATFVEPTVTAGKTVGVTVGAALASAALVEPSVSTTKTVTISAGVATAVAEMLEATAVSPDVTISPAAAEATAFMPEALAIGGRDLAITVDAMQASAEMTEPEFSNVTNINIAAQPFKATATTPAGADSVSDGSNVNVVVTLYTTATDPFIEVIKNEFGTINPAANTKDKWFRFGQQDFGPLKNYALTTTPVEGSWIGTPEFGIRDEYMRPATHFDGDVYAVAENNDSANVNGVRTWEMVFRTETDGPLFSGDSATGGNYAYTGVSVVNGRVTVNMTVGGFPRTYASLGLVNDGEWHHLMVTIGSRGLEMWVDGVSRLVRTAGTFNTSSGAVPIAVMPIEKIGTSYDEAYTLSGDILMFAQYDRQLSREAAAAHYYAYIMATVVSASPMTAFATAGNAKGRGNRKRALMLYSTGGRQFYGDPDPTPNFAYFRIWTQNASGVRVYDERPFEFGPFTVYPRKMEIKRNEYDYSPEIFTMDDVSDLDDYDMFFFLDTPAPNVTFNDMETTGQVYNLQPQYENFIASIRRAIDTGIDFWCPQPQLAVDLDFIDTFEVTGLQREAYDVKSYVEDYAPWKTYQGGNDRTYYMDTHYLNKYRVTASLEGFTNLGGYLIDDVVYWYNYGNPFSIRPDYIKYNAKEVPNGLGLNETVYFPTPLAQLESSSTPVPPWSRTAVYSIPDGAYRGTAVAKQQTTINMAGTEVANPRANNALTIVLQPGDNVGGSPIGGKVLIDFMSAYPVESDYAETIAESPILKIQIRPFGTPEYPLLDEFDGYDYDSRRMNAYFEWREVTSTRQILDEGKDTGGKETTTTKTISYEVPFYSESEKYPVMLLRQYPWLERGLNWLSVADDAPDGSVRVLASRMEATASMPSASVAVQKHVSIPAGAPARALAQMVNPDEVVDPDVTITTLPMEATATMLGLATVVNAGPMTATADMPMPTVKATGQDYILSIRAVTSAMLYLKEDAT